MVPEVVCVLAPLSKSARKENSVMKLRKTVLRDDIATPRVSNSAHNGLARRGHVRRVCRFFDAAPHGLCAELIMKTVVSGRSDTLVHGTPNDSGNFRFADGHELARIRTNGDSTCRRACYFQ